MIAHPKTLIIRFSSIGDIVLSTPLLRCLRKRFSKSQIDYVTRREYAELVKSNHNLNYTYEFDASTGFDGLRALKKKVLAERYDLVIDIHGSVRSRFLRSMRGVDQIVTVDKRVFERSMLVRLKKNLYKGVVSVADRYIEPLEPLGVEKDDKGLELQIPDEVLFGVSGKIVTLRLNRFERVIGFCPTSRHFTKRWPLEMYAALGIQLSTSLDAKILIFGGAEEKEQTNRVALQIAEAVGSDRVTDFAGELSLLETAAAMEYCDVVVTNDSGLMHVAAAMKRKVVAIFGSTVREFGFLPISTESKILEIDGLYCRPCSHVGRRACPEGHFRCMKEIRVEEVAAAVADLFVRV